MLRLALVLGALALSPAALACSDGSCSGNCEMKSTAAAPGYEVDSAACTKASVTINGMKCGTCS